MQAVVVNSAAVERWSSGAVDRGGTQLPEFEHSVICTHVAELKKKKDN